MDELHILPGVDIHQPLPVNCERSHCQSLITRVPAVVLHVHEPGGDPKDETGHIRDHGFDPEIEASHVRDHRAGSDSHSSHDHEHMAHPNEPGHTHEHGTDGDARHV